MKSFFACLILILSSANVLAQQSHGQSWDSILRDLSAKGVDQIGDFDIQSFRDEAKKIQWKNLESDARPEFVGTRQSAYYLIQNKTVYVSSKLPALNADNLAALELHEALGALGYKDHHYQISTGLNLLSRLNSPRERVELQKIYSQSIFSKNNLLQSKGSGSGTSVGGGGDLIALSMKNLVLNEILNNGELVVWEFLKTYPLINFEPQYHPQRQFVALKYNYDASPARLRKQLRGVKPYELGQEEMISIYVPALIWQKGGPPRRALIDEVKQRVLELFPAHRRTAMFSYQPDCSTKTFLFPVSRIIEVRVIQEMRGMLMAGCHPMSLSMEVRAPRFDDSPPPKAVQKDNSKISLNCIFGYDGKVLLQNEAIFKNGKASSQTFATMLPDFSVIIGIVSVNKNGKIDEYVLFNKKKEQKVLENIRNPNKPISLQAISGHQAAFVCLPKDE